MNRRTWHMNLTARNMKQHLVIKKNGEKDLSRNSIFGALSVSSISDAAMER